MAIGKQKARESVSSKVRMLVCVAQQQKGCFLVRRPA